MSEVIIHDAPTDWISPPKFDARLAIQTARNIGSAKGELGGGGIVHGGSMPQPAGGA
jgi:hypothetical protein